MKKINNTYLLTAATLIMMLWSINTYSQFSKAEIRATGLTCSMCSNAINKQLKSLPEVVNVETDLNTNTFTVTLTEGNTLSPKAFKEKVEKAGFFIGSLVLTTNAETIKKDGYILVNNTSNNKAEVQIQILDKGYVTDKEFKKLSKSLKNIATYISNNEDHFHVRYLN